MIYYIIYFSLGSLCLFNQFTKKEHRNVILYISAILILLFQSLRWRTGTDWEPYLLEFINVNKPNYTDEFEFGYKLLNSCINTIIPNYTIFLFVECGLNLYFQIRFLKWMPINNKPLGLLYLFTLAIFPIRYTLASSIVLYSYKYIIEKRILPFILLILIAFSIHRTAIIFLPIYFIYRSNLNLKSICIIYFSSICLGLLSDYTFGNILRTATAVYGSMNNVIQSKMDAYITGEIPEYAKLTPIRFCLSLINSTFFILVFYYYRNKYYITNITYSIMFNLYIIGISFNRIFLQIIPDFARLTSLFTGGFIIMIIMIISKLSKHNQLVLYSFLIIYFFIGYYSHINGIYSDLFIPYYSIFSSTERIIVY